tara:strand:+ start:211 stop:1092 length:882 start_codon:yes stop_codon:yes gene_type:complete
LITSIIFSKDRALQLDLTLKTIGKNFDLCDDVIVIYKTSERQYKESYENLKAEHPNVSFYEQSHSLFVDILGIVSGAASNYVCFFTDDNIVYRKVSINNLQLNHVFNSGASCLSLRVGVNTTQRDYGDGTLRNDNIPGEVFSDPPFIVWNRTSIPTCGYWAYPLSVDGHIFKRETMLEFCIELEVLNKHYQHRGIPRENWCWSQTPNEFESKLQRFYFDLPVMMYALEQSCVVNSPNNRVQSYAENRSGDQFSYTPSELNHLYMSGKRLNVDKIDFSDIVCPHQEIDILEGLE